MYIYVCGTPRRPSTNSEGPREEVRRKEERLEKLIRARVAATSCIAGVCKKILRRRLASKTQNQGLESSFCCWIAGERLL